MQLVLTRLYIFTPVWYRVHINIPMFILLVLQSGSHLYGNVKETHWLVSAQISPFQFCPSQAAAQKILFQDSLKLIFLLFYKRFRCVPKNSGSIELICQSAATDKFKTSKHIFLYLFICYCCPAASASFQSI